MATKKKPARPSTKSRRKGGNSLFNRASKLSFKTLFLFALVFAGIGGYLLWQGYAATTSLDYRSLNADLSKGESRSPTLVNEKGK